MLTLLLALSLAYPPGDWPALWPADDRPDLPPLAALRQFPPAHRAREMRGLAIEYRGYLDASTAHRDAAYAAAAYARWDVWDDLCIAHDAGDAIVRRLALRRMLRALGPEDFAAGLLPYPLPTDLFASIP